MDKKVSRFFDCSWGNAFVFQKSSSTEKSYGEEGGCDIFPSKFFCPKSPKNIVGEPFCVSEMFWYRNVFFSQFFARKFVVREKFMEKKGGVTFFRRESSNDSKKLGDPVFQKILHEIFWMIGVSRFSVEELLVSQYRKICGAASNVGTQKIYESWRTLFCLSEKF